MKWTGSGSPATRFLDSPCDSFLNSEYLTYKLPVHDGLFPTVSWGLSTKRTVHWDTKGSLMMTTPFWHSQHVEKRPSSPCAAVWGWTIFLSFLEFRLLLMTQVSLCSWSFLIFHAVAFSFLSSGTLKMAIPGQSDHLIFTHQSLISDKITALSQREVLASRTSTFSFTRKILLSMVTWMKNSNLWLRSDWIIFFVLDSRFIFRQ